jgi:hypothetical protein
MNQQIDMDGNLHDLAPRCEQDHLFTADPQIRGQIAMDADEARRNGYGMTGKHVRLPDGRTGRVTVVDDRAGRESATALGRLDNADDAFSARVIDLEVMPSQTTVGRYRIEPPPDDSDRIAYVLVSPRGKRYGLLRNEPRPHMMFAIHMDRFGCAEHVGWFTDKDGTLKEA